MSRNVLYIAVMALVSYTIRVLPLTLIRKPIRNTFIQSFLYYVPYVTLAVMTFPAILHATQSPISGAVALIAGNHRRMARRRIISGIRDLLRTGFPDRAVYLKKLISQLKFLALSSVMNLLCYSYDTDQPEISHNFSSGRSVIVNGRL